MAQVVAEFSRRTSTSKDIAMPEPAQSATAFLSRLFAAIRAPSHQEASSASEPRNRTIVCQHGLLTTWTVYESTTTGSSPRLAAFQTCAWILIRKS
ncbi:MAG: hypothetical protein QM765_48740 [Myxococcales bacterium]